MDSEGREMLSKQDSAAIGALHNGGHGEILRGS